MRFLSTFISCILAFLTLWYFIPTEEECKIYDTTLRLHVIANSDSEEDQRVKLLVRDAVLEHISAYDSESKEEAILQISADMEEIEKIAEDVLISNGMSGDVSIEIGKEQYPVRYYEDFSLPAGEYTSVKIMIGDAEGQNWWCVLFPPLCTSFAVSSDENEYVDVGLSKDQYNMITGTDGSYRVKFKLLEIAAGALGVEY